MLETPNNELRVCSVSFMSTIVYTLHIYNGGGNPVTCMHALLNKTMLNYFPIHLPSLDTIMYTVKDINRESPRNTKGEWLYESIS